MNIISNRESLVEAFTKVILAENTIIKYYHYNDNKFNINDIISKSYDNKQSVSDIYKSYFNNFDFNNMIYMLDHKSDEYSEETYKYGYNVMPISNVYKCYMDYSIICCQTFLKDNELDYNEEQQIAIIELFSKAYKGNNDAKETLSHLGYEGNFDKIEYICEKAKVLSIL